MVRPQAGRAAQVGAQAALLQRRGRTLPLRLAEAVAGREIAVQQVALGLVHAHEQALGRLGVDALERRVAVDRVDLVGPDVAQQPGAGVLVGVVSGCQQQVTTDRALQVERGPCPNVGLATVEVARPGADLALEHIAALHRRDCAAAAQADHAFDQASSNHRPQVGHEADRAGSFLVASGHAQTHVLRLGRGQQRQLGLAIDHLELHPGRAAVQVEGARPQLVGAGAGQQQPAAAGFHRHHHRAGQRRTLAVAELQADPHRALAIGRHRVAVKFNHDPADRRIGREVQAVLRRPQHLRSDRILAGRSRIKGRAVAGDGRIADAAWLGQHGRRDGPCHGGDPGSPQPISASHRRLPVSGGSSARPASAGSVHLRVCQALGDGVSARAGSHCRCPGWAH